MLLYSKNYKIGGNKNEKVKLQGQLGLKPISGLKEERKGEPATTTNNGTSVK